MKRRLRISALVLAVAALAAWVATGGHRGWTQTRVPVRSLDPVTGLEGIRYERRFVPGVDFLGAAAVLASLVAVASLFVRRVDNPKPDPTA